MDSQTTIQVSRTVFNKFRPVMINDMGEIMEEDITSEVIDAYGFIEVRGFDGNIAKIMLCYDRPE